MSPQYEFYIYCFYCNKHSSYLLTEEAFLSLSVVDQKRAVRDVYGQKELLVSGTVV